jgi:hypothetical protein
MTRWKTLGGEQWESCIICGERTEVGQRVLGALDNRVGAIHRGNCLVRYAQMKAEERWAQQPVVDRRHARRARG